MRASRLYGVMRSGAEFFAPLWRANVYRFTQGLHGRALLPFYAKTSSLLPNPHPMLKTG